MNLYGLTVDYQKALDGVMNSIDEETGEVDVEALVQLDAASEQFEQKALDYSGFIRALLGRNNEIEAEIARLTAIKVRLDKLTERMTNNLSQACLAVGKEKISGIHSSISFRKSEKVDIIDESAVPDEYKKAVLKVDKTAVKNAIKAGISVNGAQLLECKNIQIK